LKPSHRVRAAYPEALSKSLWFFDGNAPAGRKVHDVTVVAASHEERAARGVEPHLLPVRLETFHDHSRAGEGCMSAQENLNRRSEPPDAETPPPRDDERRLREVVLGRHGLHHLRGRIGGQHDTCRLMAGEVPGRERVHVVEPGRASVR
jgi:hypothetical protein